MKHKKKILTTSIIAILSSYIQANDYISIISQEENIYDVIENSFSVSSEWVDYGTEFNCVKEFSEYDFPLDQSFTQNENCLQKQERTVTTNELFNGAPRTTIEKESQNVTVIITYLDTGKENYNTGLQRVQYSAWIDNDLNYSCDSFSPLTSTVYKDTNFTQNRECSQEQDRTKTTYDTWADGSETINNTSLENQTLKENESQIVSGTHLENSCNNILNNGYSQGDGNYKLLTNEGSLEVKCDMTRNGGGWTLVTRLNTTDETTRRWDDSFWTNNSGTGTLSGNKDYMSSYKSADSSFNSVLLEFNYNNGVLISEFNNESNQLNFQDSLNLPLSNTNPDFNRISTNNSESASFFGTSLSFQVLGINGDDGFRLWYNKTPKATCNQTGGIGTLSDRNTYLDGKEYHWWIEAGYPSSNPSCQENYYRSYLGTNHGGSHSVITDPASETLIGNPDFYTTDIINIYIK